MPGLVKHVSAVYTQQTIFVFHTTMQRNTLVMSAFCCIFCAAKALFLLGRAHFASSRSQQVTAISWVPRVRSNCGSRNQSPRLRLPRPAAPDRKRCGSILPKSLLRKKERNGLIERCVSIFERRCSYNILILPNTAFFD